MGQEIVYCSVCGDRIPGSDLEKGRAVVVLRKHFCKICAVAISKEGGLISPWLRLLRSTGSLVAERWGSGYVRLIG